MLQSLTLTALVTLATAPLLTGCSGKDTLEFDSTAQSLTAPLASFADCPTLAANVTAVAPNGQIVLTKACFEDDTGKYYNAFLSDSNLPAPGLAVLPADRKYSFVVQFGSGWIPSASAVAQADVAHAYAGAYNIYSSCAATPDDISGDLLTTTASLDGDVLTISLPQAVPSGDQVAFELNLSALFPAQYPCQSGFDAGSFFCQAFSARLYADHAPPLAATCSQ